MIISSAAKKKEKKIKRPQITLVTGKHSRPKCPEKHIQNPVYYQL